MPRVTPQVYCRPPLERMMRIHALLQNAEYPNCSSLADELEVSPRTIARDLDFMRDRLNLPIEWSARHNGYHYSRKVEHFPQTPVNEAETFAFLVAQKAIAQYHGTPFQQPLETAFRRLTGQLDQTVRFSVGNLEKVLSFRPFAPDDADLRTFEMVTRSLRERRVLKILYRNRAATTPQPRNVHPYHLACVDNHWYLLAFDLKRKGMRTFALTRVKHAEVSHERYTIPASFDAHEYLRSSFGVFKGDAEGDYEVVVDFDPWAADEIRGRRWHESQQFTELSRGFLRLRMRLNNLEEVERWLLSFGIHATIVRPRSLIERFRRTAEQLAQRYAAETPIPKDPYPQGPAPPGA